MKRFDTGGVEINLLLWFPGADAAYDLRVWAIMRPSRLGLNDDVPLLPPQFHDMIKAGVLTRLLEFGGVQVENAVIWPSLYQAQIKKLIAYNRKWWQEHEREDYKKPYLL